MVKSPKNTPTKDYFPRIHGGILGVNISSSPKAVLLTKIEAYLAKIGHFKAKKPLFVTTPNPEHAVLTHDDRSFAKIIQNSDISLCDGVGLLAGVEYHNKIKSQNSKVKINKDPLSLVVRLYTFVQSFFYVLVNGSSSDGIKVIKGRDFLLDLLKIADKKHYKVFLLGSSSLVLGKFVEKMSKKYPSVQFSYDHDLIIDNEGVPVDRVQEKKERGVITKINKFRPDMLFVAFGAPKQEKWVYRQLKNLKTDLVMVVGGSFDYHAGTRMNVPEVLNSLGLEWMWRLLTGSQKLERIYSAVIRFPILLINTPIAK